MLYFVGKVNVFQPKYKIIEVFSCHYLSVKPNEATLIFTSSALSSSVAQAVMVAPVVTTSSMIRMC